jgi:hypothetical protein
MCRSALRLFLIIAGCVVMAAAQNQPPGYVVDQCIKAAPGKGAEATAYIREVLTKTAQVRVDEGTAAWYLAISAVVPAGSDARCDYHLVTGYKGFPPEASAERTAAARKKAGITLTPEELSARANSVGHAVSIDYWQAVADVGPNVEKGQYVRINYYKAKPGQTLGAHLTLETTGWKPYVESLKDLGIGWHLNALYLPGGTSRQYDSMTADVSPTWEMLGKPLPGGAAAWAKVHPELKSADYLKQINETTERVSVELYRVGESVHPK